MAILKEEELIAAIATPLGEGAIAMVRLSGDGAIELVNRVFIPRRKEAVLSKLPSHKMSLGNIVDLQRNRVDEVLVCPMRAPHTYTRQDMVEIYCHGGIFAVRQVLELVINLGARLAEPGEFTKRAFLNGRIDLAQAEAVLDLIRARSKKGAEAAIKQLEGGLSHVVGSLRKELMQILAETEAVIDFPEDVEEADQQIFIQRIGLIIEQVQSFLNSARLGKIYREGLATVLIGKPNTGKSTLLNCLLGEDRALVTEVPGTTRDLIEEGLNVGGVPLRIIDTAGIREKAGPVEKLGIEKTRNALNQAEVAIALFDATDQLSDEDYQVLEMIKGKRAIIVLNKIDLPEQILKKTDLENKVRDTAVVEISARQGWGIEKLEGIVLELIGAGKVSVEPVMITRTRHRSLLEHVLQCLRDARDGAGGGQPLDCIAVDLWEAWYRLGEITGDALGEEIINKIFEDFCIGK